MPKKPLCNFSAIGQPYVVYNVSLPMYIVEEMTNSGNTVSEYIKNAIITSLINDGKNICRHCDYGLK